MKTRIIPISIFLLLFIISSCNRNKFNHDDSGIFETTEIIVSAEASGKIKEFNVTEGDMLTKGQ